VCVSVCVFFFQIRLLDKLLTKSGMGIMPMEGATPPPILILYRQ